MTETNKDNPEAPLSEVSSAGEAQAASAPVTTEAPAAEVVENISIPQAPEAPEVPATPEPSAEAAAPAEPEAPAAETPAPAEPEAPKAETPAPAEPEAPKAQAPAPAEPEAVPAAEAAPAPAEPEAVPAAEAAPAEPEAPKTETETPAPAEPEAPMAQAPAPAEPEAVPAAEAAPAPAEPEGAPAAEAAPAEPEAPETETETPAPAEPEAAPAAEAAPAEPEAPAAQAPAPGAEVPTDPPPAAPHLTEGLGLPEAGAILGPPNLGGFESGEIVTGKVLTVNKREAEVDLSDGKVGVISDRHWSSGTQVDLTTVLKTGDDVDAAVLARADIKKRITLSHLWAQQKRGWETAEAAAKAKGDVTGTVTETVKGGLSLDVNGIRAFMPASLVDLHTVSDLKPYIGQTFEVRVIEADRTKQRLIVSRKAAMRSSQRQEAKAAMADIKVGQTMQGKVAQITDFGAFVDVEGIRGLVHKSEIGWSRARDPQRDLKVGQEVEVTVLKVQPSRNRLGLSMRSGNDPLSEVKKGSRFEGTVSRLADFGAFVALPSGVEGLVHVSEMAEYRVFAPEEIVIPGEKVWVKVLKIDKKRRTIDLSMAQAVAPDPPAEVDEAKAAEEAPAADEAPAEETAATDEAPATEAPAEETAATDEAPATEAPAEETAAPDEAPATEAPADAAAPTEAPTNDDHAEDAAPATEASSEDE